MPVGTPEAVKAWFYPGQNYGHDFVYPKPKAVVLAKATKTPVPSMPAEHEASITKPAPTAKEPHVVAMQAAPLKAQKPTGEEVEIAEVFFTEPEPAPAPNPPQTPAKLPATGSNVPLIGLAGLLCLALAFSLRLVRNKFQ
jgi:LPXTG-motif cell wall-anchored protein